VVVLKAFQALADENRLQILEALRDGERCVCELQSSLHLGQSLLSHHLKALKEAGLVRARREGRWAHYSLVFEVLEDLEAWLSSTRAEAETAGPRRAAC
jgi:ArsR family transcriptional regulator